MLNSRNIDSLNVFFFDQNVDLNNDFNDFTITQVFSTAISSVFSLFYSEKLDELFTIFDSIEYVEDFQNDEKNNSNIHIENDHAEIDFRNNDRSVAVQSIRYYENNDDHDQIVKNIHNMNNNSREDFHNDENMNMNIVNVNSLQFENSKINETETKTKTKTKTKDFHEKNVNSISANVVSQNKNDDAEIFDHDDDNFFIVDILSH